MFLRRLLRVDAGALVRLRPAGEGLVALWAWLPWEVLVSRTLPGTAAADATVGARALLGELTAGGGLPGRRDADWHWALPGSSGVVIEALPADSVRDLGSAAERTVRAALARDRRIGERVVRDAVLDHVAIVVESAVTTVSVTNVTLASPTERNVRIEVPQRLVQAVVRMGFIRHESSDREPTVRVLHSEPFVGLAAEYGVAWYRRPADLPVRPIIRTDEPR